MPQESSDSASRADRPRWLGYAQLGLILIAIVVALYFARAPDRVERGATAATTAGSDKPAVRVVQPGPKKYAFTVRVTGTVTLERKTKVVSEVVGRVVWVSPKFTTGGSIPANETFIRIDPAEFEIRVRAAEMRVKEAEASLQIQNSLAREGAEKFAKANPGAEIPERVRRISPIARTEGPAGAGAGGAGTGQVAACAHEHFVALRQPGGAFGRRSRRTGRPGRKCRALVGARRRLPARYIAGQGAGRAEGSEKLRTDGRARCASLHLVRKIRRRSGPRVVHCRAAYPPGVDVPEVRRRIRRRTRLPAPGTFVEIAVAGPTLDRVFVLPETAARDRDSIWVVRKGALAPFTPKTLGRTRDGWIVEPFDAGEGVVVGVLAKAREGLQVAARAIRAPE